MAVICILQISERREYDNQSWFQACVVTQKNSFVG